MQSDLTIAYWPMKGLAEPQRWLMSYMELEFTEVNPTKEEWAAQKSQLHQDGMAFPGLPYLTDKDGWMMSESGAIPVYLTLTYGKPELLGKGWKDQSRMMEITGVFEDIRKEITKACFNPEYSTAMLALSEAGSKVMTKLQYLSDYLGEKDFFLGYLTYSDILFGYFVGIFGYLFTTAGIKSPLEGFARFTALAQRVQQLPGIKEYLASPNGQRPYLPPGALRWQQETPETA